jgi:hypothetical protein
MNYNYYSNNPLKIPLVMTNYKHKFKLIHLILIKIKEQVICFENKKGYEIKRGFSNINPNFEIPELRGTKNKPSSVCKL